MRCCASSEARESCVDSHLIQRMSAWFYFIFRPCVRASGMNYGASCIQSPRFHHESLTSKAVVS